MLCARILTLNGEELGKLQIPIQPVTSGHQVQLGVLVGRGSQADSCVGNVLIEQG
jgi:hypothetical protein